MCGARTYPRLGPRSIYGMLKSCRLRLRAACSCSSEGSLDGASSPCVAQLCPHLSQQDDIRALHPGVSLYALRNSVARRVSKVLAPKPVYRIPTDVQVDSTMQQVCQLRAKADMCCHHDAQTALLWTVIHTLQGAV